MKTPNQYSNEYKNTSVGTFACSAQHYMSLIKCLGAIIRFKIYIWNTLQLGFGRIPLAYL
jgi:hypothetical protein